MEQQKQQIIYLNAHRTENAENQLDNSQNQYRCAMSGNRLDGQCELLIYNCYQRTAELFSLYFSSEGQITYQYFQAEEVIRWKQSRKIVLISYRQAMTLLGDAVRRNYREQNPWNMEHTSIHIQRVWQNEYYNSTHNNLSWLLKERDYIPFIRQYFRAVNNKDAVLLYDMLIESKRNGISRDLYAYNWNHILEEVKIIDYAVINSKKSFDGENRAYFLATCCEDENGEYLSVDICLHLTRENGYIRLREEHILEANHITSCCMEI